MKKIYILTAVLALLTLSLNAQFDATKKVAQTQQTAPTGKKVDTQLEGMKKASKPAFNRANRAPSRATVTGSVTAADGTSNSTGYQYLPVYGYYFEQAQTNQMIYTATQLSGLQTGDKITSLTFYPNGNINFSGGSITLSLGNTSISQFSSNSALNVSTTQVARVTTYPVSNGGWTITFTNPFLYTGENILVQVATTSGDYGRTYFYGQDQSNYQSRNSYGSTNLYYFLPKVTLAYERSTDPEISASTNSVNLSSIPGGTATQTVTVTGLNLTEGITASISGGSEFSVSPASLGTTGGDLAISYTPTAVGTHTATLTLSSPGADPVNITLNGTCSYDLTICDGTETNTNLPIYGYYYDNYQKNQMIYPESMVGDLSGRVITSMTFYAASDFNFSGGQLTVRLGTTDQTSYTGKVRLQPADMAIVKSGFDVPSGGNTWTIEFDTPFEYNGGNLVVDFEETSHGSGTGSYSSGFSFYGTTHSGGGFYSYGSTYSADFGSVYSGGSVQNFLPKVTIASESNEPRHDLGIALSAPTTAGAGNTVDVTATVTNNGEFAENGYTVTVSDGTNIVNITAQEALGIGETTTFTVQFATSPDAGGSTVNYTATVACTDDADATNNSATASTSLFNLPPPENVAATATGNTGTMTWDAPSNLPTVTTTVTETVTEGFEDTSLYPEFSLGGITATQHSGSIGNWTLYDATGSTVYGYQSITVPNLGDPQAWMVFAPGSSQLSQSLTDTQAAHNGNQMMASFCPYSSTIASDHWLISPLLSGNAQTISFYARELTDQYGAETFEVLYSTTDNNPASFIEPQSLSCTSTDWAQFTAELPAGAKYFAIRHTSTDVFALFVDDITYEISNVVETQLAPESYNIYLDGQFVTNVDANTFSYTFSNVADGEHECAVSAVYSYGESVAVPAEFTILPTPNAPAVSSNDGTTSTTITITPDPATDGNLVYYVDNNGQQTQDLTFPRGATDYVVTVHAYTTATSNYNESPEAVIPVTIPALPQTPAPTIAISSQTDDEVTITATGNGTVILNIPGYPQATGNGSASITVPRHMSDYVVTATATAQASGELVSTTTTQNITVPGMSNDGWTQMTGTYDNPNDLLSFLTLDANADTTMVMLLDQFLQSTVFNDHPSSYTYVLKETKVINGVDSTMTSNPATIPVYKTNSTMRGLYTEAQVLADDYADEANRLTANAVNGEIDYDVVPDNNVLYYSLYRGGIQEETPAIDVPHRISQLQKFEDKVGDNVTYYFTENHLTGILPRYDHEDNIGSQIVERLDVDYVTGETGNQMSYVPVIWTFGLYTARGDGKNNSYGSDIKVNELGGVDVSSDIIVNWSDNNKMKVNGVDYYVVSPVITLDAVAPELVKANDNESYKYEPYMYRVWCTYTDAHNFGHVVNPDGINYSLIETGLIEAPFLIGEVQADTLSDPSHVVIGRDLGHVSPQTQWSFAVTKEAALNNDIKFVVRYYYKKVVTEPASPDQPAGMRGNRDGGADYAIYETRTSSSDIVTGVNELWNTGKVVISQTYVNAQGMQSDKPFDGLNIVVTRFSDGTTTTTKVVR